MSESCRWCRYRWGMSSVTVGQSRSPSVTVWIRLHYVPMFDTVSHMSCMFVLLVNVCHVSYVCNSAMYVMSSMYSLVCSAFLIRPTLELVPSAYLITIPMLPNHVAEWNRIKRCDPIDVGRSPGMCVCTIWIDVKLLILQGVTGVPGGSVTNEDTSPGPVQTYLQDSGGAPGRNYKSQLVATGVLYIYFFISPVRFNCVVFARPMRSTSVIR